MNVRERIEPVLILLAALMVFFTGVLIGVEHYFKDDGQVFQVISGLLTGIAGAFLMRVKPPGQSQPGNPDNTILTQTTSSVSLPSAPVAGEKQP